MCVIGAWLIHIICILALKILYDILPSISQETSWTLVNTTYMFATYLMLYVHSPSSSIHSSPTQHNTLRPSHHVDAIHTSELSHYAIIFANTFCFSQPLRPRHPLRIQRRRLRQPQHVGADRQRGPIHPGEKIPLSGAHMSVFGEHALHTV